MIRVENNKIIVHDIGILIVPKYVAKIVEFVLRNPYCTLSINDFCECLEKISYRNYEELPEALRKFIKPRYLKKLREYWILVVADFIKYVDGMVKPLNK